MNALTGFKRQGKVFRDSTDKETAGGIRACHGGQCIYKVYAMAGLRFGYALCTDQMILERMESPPALERIGAGRAPLYLP